MNITSADLLNFLVHSEFYRLSNYLLNLLPSNSAWSKATATSGALYLGQPGTYRYAFHTLIL